MGNVDKVLTKKKENLRRRTEDCQKRKSKEEKDRRTCKEKITLLASSSSENEIDKTDSDIEVEKKYLCAAVSVSGKPMTPKPKRVKILNDKLLVSLEMAKLSDRKAALVLIPEIQSVGCNPSNFNISQSSVRRDKIKIKEKLQKVLRRSSNLQFL